MLDLGVPADFLKFNPSFWITLTRELYELCWKLLTFRRMKPTERESGAVVFTGDELPSDKR